MVLWREGQCDTGSVLFLFAIESILSSRITTMVTADTTSFNQWLFSINTERTSLEEDESTEPPLLPEPSSSLRSLTTTLPDRFDRASMVAASDVVRALFGAQVGPCWGDFFCTHNRIRGRLFAVTTGVLFYSNLLGFERRLCLRFADIVSITLYRTTSICIEIADYGSETYIFKSFHNREQVLQLLLGLRRLADENSSDTLKKSTVLRTQSVVHENGSYRQLEEEQQDQQQQDQERMDLMSASFVMHTSHSTSSFQLPFAPAPTNRRRAVSDSVVRFLGLQDDRPDFAQDDPFFLPRRNEMNGDTIKEEWETASREIASLEETGIDVRAYRRDLR
jgi:hypothetical protein